MAPSTAMPLALGTPSIVFIKQAEARHYSTVVQMYTDPIHAAAAAAAAAEEEDTGRRRGGLVKYTRTNVSKIR